VATVSRTLAVALHDVEPRSFPRAKEIREWLLGRGVSRVTLLVIPAADLHPIGARAPALAAWLRGRVACGDAVAQHGLAHRATGSAPWPRSMLSYWQGGAAAEFPGLAHDEAATRVRAGRRLLNEIELDPRGFVAPGYAYTRALRRILAESFDWFADLRTVRTRSHGNFRSPALCLGSSTPLKRALSPPLVRAASRGAGAVMRVDIHPADFDLPGHVNTLASLLNRADGRDVVTYDELVA
jgi:predicted deacetylase